MNDEHKEHPQPDEESMDPSPVEESEKSQASWLQTWKGRVSGVRTWADEFSSKTQSYVEDKKLKEKASQMYEATQDHLDSVSGARALKLVEERLELQQKYNDILATKLQEVVERVERLEAELQKRR